MNLINYKLEERGYIINTTNKKVVLQQPVQDIKRVVQREYFSQYFFINLKNLEKVLESKK